MAVYLFILEAFLQFIDYMPGALNLYMANPNRAGSFRLKPNLDIITKVGARDVIIKTNSHGMRWREVSLDIPQTKKRVAFMGDSFTFGLWADKVENSLVGVFDALLESHNFEVLNFGVPAYGFEDMELQIKEHVLPFQPDYIVLMFYSGNDFLDTYLGTERYYVSKRGVLKLNEENLKSKIPREFLN